MEDKKKIPAKSWHKGFTGFMVDLLSKGKFKMAAWIKGREVGYVKVHPIKKENTKPAGNRATNNHMKKSSKAKRLMAKQSKKINRGK